MRTVMSKKEAVYIYACKENKPLIEDKITEDDLSVIKIDEYDIKFFHDTLLSFCFFDAIIDPEKISDSISSNYWRLYFFKNTVYEQIIEVKFLPLDVAKKYENDNKTLPAAKLVYNEVQTNFDSNNTEIERIEKIDRAFTPQEQEIMSSFLRSSKTIKKEYYHKLSTHFEHIDSYGVSFFSISGLFPEKHFQRRILLTALAVAYQQVMEKLNSELTNITSDNKLIDIKNLKDLYIKIAKFNSLFFFKYPVKANRYIKEFWIKLDKCFYITENNNQLMNKLDNMHYILDDNFKSKLTAERENFKKQELTLINEKLDQIANHLLELTEVMSNLSKTLTVENQKPKEYQGIVGFIKRLVEYVIK